MLNLVQFEKEWKKGQQRGADIIADKYKDYKIENKEDLDNLIIELMIEYGPDGHCDGYQIIAEIIWRKFKLK